MSNAFNPFQSHKFSRERVGMLFGPKANGALAQQTFRENRALYDEVRAEAVSYGLISGEKPINPWAVPEKTYSPEEIRVRAAYTKEECRAVFNRKAGEVGNSNPTASDLQKNNPEKYAAMKLAAQSYELLPAAPAVVVSHRQKKVIESDGRFVISDELADAAHLDRGVRITADEFVTIVKAVADAKQAAATEEHNGQTS